MVDLTPATECIPPGPLWKAINTGVFPLRPRCRLEVRLKQRPEEMLAANTFLRSNFQNPEMLARNISEPRAVLLLLQLSSRQAASVIEPEGGHRSVE